jgi:hypothetical protein
MSDEAPRALQDRWCDIDGTHVALFSCVEQVAEHPEHAALFSRLHHRGEVIGQGPDVLYVRFQGEGQVISVSPQRMRLVPGEPSEHWRLTMPMPQATRTRPDGTWWC